MACTAVVVLDTLRKDAFEKHFDWLPGIRFHNAWSTSHWTVPAHGSLFSGTYPSETGVHAKSIPLDNEGPVLAERLSDAGYRTRAFSANPYISPVFNFDRGFEELTGNWRLRHLDPTLFNWNRFIANHQHEGPSRYLRAIARCVRDDCETLPSLQQGIRMKLRDLDWLGRVDDDGAAEALSYVRNADFGDNEFLYLNLMEAHSPYDPPPEYRSVDVTHGPGLRSTITGESGDVDPEMVARAYDDCVRYLTDIYEKIFAELREDFDYVVTCSDHGELLGEYGGWAHGYGLYRELTNVPLVVSGEGLADAERNETVSLVDVFATVLDLAGLDADAPGRSLLDGGRGNPFLTEYHGLTPLRVNKLRDTGVDETVLRNVDRTFRGVKCPDGYGFETPDDFKIIGEVSRANAIEHLSSLVAALDVRTTESDDSEVDAETLSQLEDLGYA